VNQPLERIELVHGDGGAATARLIQEVFLPYLGSPELREMGDSAVLALPVEGGEMNPRLCLTTDSFVVQPLFFPGGDIGKLAVCGTVNDLAVAGARPLWLTAGFILEEGLAVDRLRAVVGSMAAEAQNAGVSVVTADTKVVGRGQADGLYINTAGLGVSLSAEPISPAAVRPGDCLLVSGSIGDHGVAILAQRENIRFATPVVSDCACLARLCARLVRGLGGDLRFMRDPTRGGLATALAEAADASGCDLLLDEEAIPVRPAVRGAAEMLGLDALYLANEGKVVAVVAPGSAGRALEIMRDDPLGRDAAIIGRVETGKGLLKLTTPYGGTRLLPRLTGAPLPRIC